MPIMIPDPIPDDASVGEKTIFETLKVAGQGRDWAVLHSVSIDSRYFSFVILNPYNGAVVCLEVVADETYKFENGRWSSPSGGSPLKRAKEAMEDLKKHFATSHFCSSSPLSLRYAVAFTDGTAINEEWLLPEHLKPMFKGGKLPGLALMTEDGQVFEDALHPNSLGLALWNCATDPDEKISYEESQEAQVALDELRTDLVSTGETIRTISTIFHDNLETYNPRLLRLTDDQLKCLCLVGCQPPSMASPKSTVQEEPRCVIDGAAGTGKTVLAIEIARQHYERGETVALLCSNPYLSIRFEKWAAKLPSNTGGKVVAGTPATLPLQVLKDDPSLKDSYQKRLDSSPGLQGTLKFGYKSHEWEPFIEEIIKDLKALEPAGIFDYLIVDEAQNLCDEVFLTLMDALLKRELAKGSWIMFGDFVNQGIVLPDSLKLDNSKDTKHSKGTEALEARSELEWENSKLKINCRNTYEIFNEVDRLVDIKSPSMPGVHGPHVQIKYFKSPTELEGILDELIVDWQGRHFQSQQIILLSSGIGDEFNTQREYSGWKLLNIREEKESGLIPGAPSLGNTLRYSDIYDFQGLESDLTILVLPVTEDQVIFEGNITLPREPHLNRVLYTGMSRARTMLVIVAHETYKEILDLRANLRDKQIALQETM